MLVTWYRNSSSVPYVPTPVFNGWTNEGKLAKCGLRLCQILAHFSFSYFLQWIEDGKRDSMNEECKERENYWVLLKSVVGKMLESVIKYVMTQDVKNNSLTFPWHWTNWKCQLSEHSYCFYYPSYLLSTLISHIFTNSPWFSCPSPAPGEFYSGVLTYQQYMKCERKLGKTLNVARRMWRLHANSHWGQCEHR